MSPAVQTVHDVLNVGGKALRAFLLMAVTGAVMFLLGYLIVQGFDDDDLDLDWHADWPDLLDDVRRIDDARQVRER